MSGWAIALLAAPACLPLIMTIINLLTWQRGRRARFDGRVSVLIPARNEERNIAAAVRAAAASEHPIHEIVVYDDQSTDGTPEILRALQREIDILRVVKGNGVPDGWVGKPHACRQLAAHASGDLLLFVDADTELTPEGVGRIASLMTGSTAVVTAVPHQRMVSWGERLMLPLLMLTYTGWFPLRLVASSRDPRFCAANGQIMAVRRDAYARIGGFEAVAHEIVDDVAFCRHAKRCGERVVFADGARIASCRMYGSLSALWRGFSKNIYEGIGGTPWALLLIIVLYGGVFVAPYVALLIGLAIGASWVAAAAIGVAANVSTRALLALRYGHPASGVLSHPIAVALLCALAVNSARWSRRGRVMWAGRAYAGRRARLEAAS